MIADNIPLDPFIDLNRPDAQLGHLIISPWSFVRAVFSVF